MCTLSLITRNQSQIDLNFHSTMLMFCTICVLFHIWALCVVLHMPWYLLLVFFTNKALKGRGAGGGGSTRATEFVPRIYIYLNELYDES